MRLIAENGFGDPRNVYAWSMAHFRGRIYVGTAGRSCASRIMTIDFFLQVSDRYVTDPLPGATCPPDPYDMDLRAEIWEYTPAHREVAARLPLTRGRAEPARERQVRRPRHRVPGDDASSATREAASGSTPAA